MDEGEALRRDEDRTTQLETAEEDGLAGHERAVRTDRVRDTQRRRVQLWDREQEALAADLPHAVSLAGVAVIGRMRRVRLGDRLDEAALVHGDRAREHELRDASAEQVDHRLEVANGVRGVVEHDVEVVAMRAQRVVDRSRHSAVGVDAPSSGRQRRFVAVHDRDVVALSSELEHEVTTDVPVASHHQRAHCRDPNQGNPNVPKARRQDQQHWRGAVVSRTITA